MIWRRVECVLINCVFGYFQDFEDHPRLQQHPLQAHVSGMWCYNVIIAQFRERDASNGTNNMTTAQSTLKHPQRISRSKFPIRTD